MNRFILFTTLALAVVSIAAAASSGASSPPASGTWNINVTTRIEDDALILGDITVTADLEIVSAVLTHNSSDGHLWTIAAGVSVTFDDATLTVPDDSDAFWQLNLLPGNGSFVAANSFFGVGNTAEGLVIAAQTVDIADCVFQHGSSVEQDLRAGLNLENLEDGYTVKLLAHSDIEAERNVSSASITDSVFRVSTGYEIDGDHDRCEHDFSGSYCNAVEELDMSSRARLGSIHAVGRSSVVLSRLSLLPAGIVVESGDDGLVFGDLVLEGCELWQGRLSNLVSVEANDLEVYSELYVQRKFDLTEESPKSVFNMSDSTFDADGCAELKVDEGVIGGADNCEFANPVVTGFLHRYGDEIDMHLAGRGGKGRERRHDWEDEDEDSDDYDSDDDDDDSDDDDDDDDDDDEDSWEEHHDGSATYHDCFTLGELEEDHRRYEHGDVVTDVDEFQFCNTDFAMEFCDAPWYWMLIVIAILSTILACMCCCCGSFLVYKLVRFIAGKIAGTDAWKNLTWCRKSSAISNTSTTGYHPSTSTSSLAASANSESHTASAPPALAAPPSSYVVDEKSSSSMYPSL